MLKEAKAGASVELVVCSKGEAASSGDPDTRVAECERAAAMLGAGLRFADLGGDARIERSNANALALAREIRRARPRVLLAPSLVEDQHPDHAVVGALARDAARLARYGGLEPLRDLDPWSVDTLLYYAITPGGEPRDRLPLVFEIGEVVEDWTRLMECHASQMRSRRYVELQLARARALGLQAGGASAQALWSSDALLLDRLADARGMRLY